MKIPKKQRLLLGSAVVLAFLGGVYVFTLAPRGLKGEEANVRVGDITEEVFITGVVKTARKVTLSFERAGTLRTLPYAVGADIARETVLASLTNGAESASVSEAEAQVAITEAKLSKVLQGTREEELKLKEAEIGKADAALQSTKSKTAAAITDAYSAAEEALNRYADPFFSNDNSVTPRLTYLSGTQEAYQAEQKRVRSGAAVLDLQMLRSAADELSLRAALQDVRIVQDFFVTLGLTLRDTSGIDGTTLADYRSRVTSARNALAASITSLQNQLNALSEDAAELERTNRALELASAKATTETVREAEQEVAQAKAKLLNAKAAYEKTLLRAPFSGTIASRNVELGETVSSGVAIMEFLGTDGFVIEANVPEADITRIEVGDKADVTLDAYGEDVGFTARVAQIDPASTDVDGVATYKTTLSLEGGDAKLRSGMTANVSVKKTLKKEAVLIPARAVISENGASYVMRKSAEGALKVEVKTGIRSSTGELEVLSGISPDDTILIPEKK